MVSEELIQSENYLSETLESFGWRYYPVKPKDILAVDEFRVSLKRINIDLEDEEVDEVLNYLRTRPTTTEGSREVLGVIKKGHTIQDSEGNLKNVKLIDYSNPGENSLIYSRQVSFKGEITPDIVLFINGIPIVVIECKKMTVDWSEGYNDIKNYEERVPELFSYAQIGVSFANKLVYFPIVRGENVAVDEWKPQYDFLRPETVLDIVRYFTYYWETDGEITKVLPRYMQYNAVRSIVERVANYAKGVEDRNKGLIWHWQGTGKTLTMIFAAKKIRELLGNPTVFFIVDRIDLQNQLSDELTELGISYEVIDSIHNLKEVLSHADGKRGFFITLIHKFREEELSELKKQMENSQWNIMNRKDVICLIDEGHRTQYGDLAGTMRKMLNNASFFAFTGTPLNKKGRDTYRDFGYKDEPYLDRYFITDSIEDGYTVKIAYQSRLDNEHLDKENLEVFLNSRMEEIPEEYRQRVENDLKKKLNKVRIILEDTKRINRVARDVAAHYQKNIKPFKAVVVAVSRKACLDYKEALDKFFNKNETEIVMTFSQYDDQRMLDYQGYQMKKYGKNELKAVHKEIINRFKKEDNPLKILIVTEMLLTGFDAPILQAMYLDKPLKEHRLLQAIARTNRPYNKEGHDIKGSGMIIDYVGVFRNLKKAFQIYEEEDIKGAAYDIEEIKEELAEKIEQAFNLFDFELSKDRDVINRAALVLDEKIDEFRKLYFQIRNLYRVLLEDRTQFKKDFEILTELYHAYLRREKDLRADIEQKRDQFYQEALKFIHETIDMDKIKNDYPVVTINDEFLNKIKSDKQKRKFYDLLFAVKSYTKKESADENVVERVERIIKDWNDRHKEMDAIYEELESVAEVINEERKEKEKLGLNEKEYRILKLLRSHIKGVEDQTLVSSLKDMMFKVDSVTFPRWHEKGEVVKEVSQKILLHLIKNFRDEIDDAQKTRDEIVRFLKLQSEKEVRFS